MRIKIILLISVLVLCKLSAQECADPANIYTFYYDGRKYEIVKENKDWESAAACADERGGILARIDSKEEQDTIYYHLQNAGISYSSTRSPDGGDGAYVWIGGTDKLVEGDWIWDGANYGYGDQFWQGTYSGDQIGGLYNNWGTEPDNFGNQDGLAIALTNWPLGDASQWNDLNLRNDLYYLIEYDNTTFKINSLDYLHDEELLVLKPDLKYSFDSLLVSVNDSIINSFFNVTPADTSLTIAFTISETQVIRVRLLAFSEEKTAITNEYEMAVYSYSNPVQSYYTDFEDLPDQEFIGDYFDIHIPGGFKNKAIHSEHNYQLSVNQTYTLTKPIIVSDTEALIKYSDVAIVEPGDSGAQFGDNNFKDYVVVEGSKKVGEWFPLAPGYDAGLYPDWLTAWSNVTLYRKFFKSHTIDLTDTFNAGDTILIRFRLYSDDEVAGWGWVVDSLEIQDFVLDKKDFITTTNYYSLKGNYPNPFNPSTTIEYMLGKQNYVTLEIYDLLGKVVKTLVNEKQSAGEYSIAFDGSNISSGIYYYRLSVRGKSTDYSETKKMVLLR